MFEDSKFYGKPIAIVFVNEGCKGCKDVLNALTNNADIKRKYVLTSLDSFLDYPYFARLTRGLLPTVSVVDHEGNLIGIVESSNADYVLEKLDDIYQRLGKLARIPYGLVPRETDFELVRAFDVVNRVLSGVPGDFRIAQLVSWIAKEDQNYSLAMKYFRPFDKFAEYLSFKRTVEVGRTCSELGIASELGLISEYGGLLECVSNDGAVSRRPKSDPLGLLIDQAYVGNGLLSAYERTGDMTYLESAKKVFRWVLSNLSYDVGFLDVRPLDPITSKPVVDPIMNSEFAVFASRLWLVTGEEEALKAAEKAIKASAWSESPLVESRLAIAELKKSYGYLSKSCDDLRCEELSNLDCQVKFKGQCFNSLQEIEEKIKAF